MDYFVLSNPRMNISKLFDKTNTALQFKSIMIYTFFNILFIAPVFQNNIFCHIIFWIDF